jgi:hypothetical protein
MSVKGCNAAALLRRRPIDDNARKRRRLLGRSRRGGVLAPDEHGCRALVVARRRDRLGVARRPRRAALAARERASGCTPASTATFAAARA